MSVKRRKINERVINRILEGHKNYLDPSKVSAFGDFRGCDVSGFDFRGRWLVGVPFSNADCTGCNFRGLNLTGVIFDGTILTRTDFTGAYSRVFFDGEKPGKNKKRKCNSIDRRDAA